MTSQHFWKGNMYNIQYIIIFIVMSINMSINMGMNKHEHQHGHEHLRRVEHKTLFFLFWWARWAWKASWRQANMIRRREARCVSKTRKWRSTDEQVCWLARYSFQNFGKKCCLSDKREALTNRYVNSDFALLSDRRCSKMPLVFETAISPTHTYTMFVFENYYLSLYLYLYLL